MTVQYDCDCLRRRHTNIIFDTEETLLKLPLVKQSIMCYALFRRGKRALRNKVIDRRAEWQARQAQNLLQAATCGFRFRCRQQFILSSHEIRWDVLAPFAHKLDYWACFSERRQLSGLSGWEVKIMNEFLEWLKENKISIHGKYREKRWGSISRSEQGDWHIRICVQYDEYLESVLARETVEMQELVKKRTGHKGCGRCIDGKCAFTGFDLVNPTDEQIELAKRLIKFRIDAIKDGRVPRCSYIKISKRGEAIEPCAVHKVCDPKCKAMKKY